MNNRIPYKFTREIARELIADARKLAYNEKVDQLDCSVSFARQKTNKTVEEVIEIGLALPNTLYNFIFRDMSFFPQDFIENRSHWDVGLSTIGVRPEYFLWLKLTDEDGLRLIEKYNLHKIS